MVEEHRGDLHVHTCLSPCGDLSMLPRAIIRMAKEKNLDIIGICDHNSTANVMAVKKVGQKEGMAVIGGIEITSQEEVHIMALFDNEDALAHIQEIVYEHLPGTNDEDAFGEQVVVDEADEVVALNEKLLIGATTLMIDEVVSLIHQLGGVAIASHVDREAFSIIGQLGFIPEGLALDALEVSARSTISETRKKFPQVKNFPLVSFSDAHYPEDIGKRSTSFLIEKPSVMEIQKAIHGIEGRMVLGG
jgi:predicted metal-dependent phosphoesterase TrpH